MAEATFDAAPVMSWAMVGADGIEPPTAGV